MSWIRRITVICDSCWLCFTLHLSDELNNALGAVARSFGVKSLRIDGQLWHLCPSCHEAAQELDEAALKELLLSGLHVSGEPRKAERRMMHNLSDRARHIKDEIEAKRDLIELPDLAEGERQ